MKLDYNIVLLRTSSRGDCPVVEQITVDNIDKALDTFRAQFETHREPIDDGLYLLELKIVNPDSF